VKLVPFPIAVSKQSAATSRLSSELFPFSVESSSDALKHLTFFLTAKVSYFQSGLAQRLFSRIPCDYDEWLGYFQSGFYFWFLAAL